MTNFDISKNANKLIGQKVSGLNLDELIDYNDFSAWYEGTEDSGEKRIIYIYNDAEMRNKQRNSISGLRTTDIPIVTIDGNQLHLYIIIGDYRIMMSRKTREYLTSPETMPPEIDNYKIINFLGRGYKGVTFKCHRKGGTRAPYAIKLTINKEYQEKSHIPEVDRMTDLAVKDRDHFPQVHDDGPWTHQELGEKFIFFVEDYVPGITLDKYLETRKENVNVSFLDRFVREMLSALVVMEELNLMHDDLHSNNIMIIETLTGIRPFLIDFGSTKNRDITKKERDDIRNLAGHIADIINIINSRDFARTKYDDFILEACRGLHAVISDDDPMRRPDSPKELLFNFESNYPRGSVKQDLKRPFDFGNAEEVLDNELLQKLSAKSFPWRERVESSSNLLVIGPRGCGKTTIYRSMSFICLADAGKIEEALDKNYIGIYISCNKDFRQRFSAIESEILIRRQNDIRHYFNLLVLREFTRTLIACQENNNLLNNDLINFIDFLNSKLNYDKRINDNNHNILRNIEAQIVRSIELVRMNIWNDLPCDKFTEQGFVDDLSSLSREKISPFQNKIIYLFIDDYTERKVPREAQRALNHILFVPNANYKSKISSEVFGVPKDQTFGGFLDQDRDYREINLGNLYYTRLPTTQQKEFIREIVDTRLNICNYEGKVDDIIGPSLYPKGKLSHSFKSEHDERMELKKNKKDLDDAGLNRKIDDEIEKKGLKTYYNGWDTICELCTGDISNILAILEKMYNTYKITKDFKARISPPKQHSVITGYSLQYIAKIKGIPEFGKELFDIVDAFGNMSATLLREQPYIKGRKGRDDPYQVIRIEMDEGYNKQAEIALEKYEELFEKLPKEVDKSMMLWILLQRNCLFIDAEESRSRRNTLSSSCCETDNFLSLCGQERIWQCRFFNRGPEGLKIFAQRRLNSSGLGRAPAPKKHLSFPAL